MDIYQEKILESISILIQENMKQLNYTLTLECKVAEALISPQYKILHNGDEYTAKAINGQTYSVGDLVYVLASNNDMSNKIILCKIP